MRRYIIIPAGFCVLLWLATPSLAVANGAAKEIIRTEAGPYDVSIRAIPIPPLTGKVHLSIGLTAKQTNESPITNATVSVIAKLSESTDQIGPLYARQSWQIYHDVDIPFDKPGNWLLTIRIETPTNQEQIYLPLEVMAAPPFDPLLAGTLLMTVLFATGYTVWWIRSHGRRNTRNKRTTL